MQKRDPIARSRDRYFWKVGHEIREDIPADHRQGNRRANPKCRTPHPRRPGVFPLFFDQFQRHLRRGEWQFFVLGPLPPQNHRHAQTRPRNRACKCKPPEQRPHPHFPRQFAPGRQTFKKEPHCAIFIGGEQPARQMRVQKLRPPVLRRGKIIGRRQMPHDQPRKIHQWKQGSHQPH